MNPEVFFFLIVSLIILGGFGIFIWSLIYCIQKKGILGFLIWFFFPVLGTLIVMALPSDREEIKLFYCDLCYHYYPENLLGAKSDCRGNICRYCLEKQIKNGDK